MKSWVWWMGWLPPWWRSLVMAPSLFIFKNYANFIGSHHHRSRISFFWRILANNMFWTKFQKYTFVIQCCIVCPMARSSTCNIFMSNPKVPCVWYGGVKYLKRFFFVWETPYLGGGEGIILCFMHEIEQFKQGLVHPMMGYNISLSSMTFWATTNDHNFNNQLNVGLLTCLPYY